MKRAFIIHGWGGYPEEGWFPWLKKELEFKRFYVSVPVMPDSDNPVIGNWVGHLSRLIGKPDENVVLVGHSIGCQTVLRYLASIDQKINCAVLVAGWLTRLTGDLSPQELEIAKPWIETPIDLNKVIDNTSKIVAIFSDNDEFVSADNHNLFKEKLGAKVIIEHNKGHFSGSDGITELPSTLEAVI